MENTVLFSGPYSKFTEVIDHIEDTIGDKKKEIWLVFDMDETLAYWDFYLPIAQRKAAKEMSAEVFFNKYDEEQKIIRPSIGPFLNSLLAKDYVINFAIYSNTQKKGRVELIAKKIKEIVEENENFRVCFLFYNHFIKNPGEVEPKRLNVNIAGLGESQYYDAKKTMETIRYGFEKANHPVNQSALFFFDDKDKHTDILSTIGKQYILMEEYKGKGNEESSASGSFFSRGSTSSGSTSSGSTSSGSAAVYIPPSSSTKRGFTNAFETSTAVPTIPAVPTTGKYVPPSMRGKGKGGRRRTRRSKIRSKKTRRGRRTH